MNYEEMRQRLRDIVEGMMRTDGMECVILAVKFGTSVIAEVNSHGGPGLALTLVQDVAQKIVALADAEGIKKP